MAQFQFQFKPEEVQEIMLRHMIVEGMISDKERAFFKEMHKVGSRTSMEFVVETPVLDEVK